MTDHKADLQRLEKQITELSDALAHLASRDDFLHLVKIIHRPGWTTPAELALVRASIEVLHGQVRSLQTFKGDLISASERVGARPQETVR